MKTIDRTELASFPTFHSIPTIHFSWVSGNKKKSEKTGVKISHLWGATLEYLPLWRTLCPKQGTI